VETADGQARFPMVLPMNLLPFDVTSVIEQTASEVGVLMMVACDERQSGSHGYSGRIAPVFVASQAVQTCSATLQTVFCA